MIHVNYLEILAKNVDDELHKRGLNRSDLAKMLKVSPQTISRYLGGHNVPGVDKVVLLGEALGLSPARLLASKEELEFWDPSQKSVFSAEMNARFEQMMAALEESRARRKSTPETQRSPKEELLARLRHVSEQDAATLLRILPPLHSIDSKKSGTD